MSSTDPQVPAQPTVAGVSVTGPDGGEPIQLGPTLIRILETNLLLKPRRAVSCDPQYVVS